MTNAATVDISVDQGTDLAVQIVWTDYYAVPFTVSDPMAMEIRGPQGQLIHRLVSGANPVETGSEITYNSDEGIIQLFIGAHVTQHIAPGIYYYDLFVSYTDNNPLLNSPVNRRTKLLAGRVIVEGRITRDV